MTKYFFLKNYPLNPISSIWHWKHPDWEMIYTAQIVCPDLEFFYEMKNVKMNLILPKWIDMWLEIFLWQI